MKLLFSIFLVLFSVNVWAQSYSDLDELGETPADGDLVFLRDTSVGTGFTTSTLKWITVANLMSYAGTGTVDVSGTPVALDIARWIDEDTLEGLSYAEFRIALGLVVGTDVLAQQTIGIDDDNLVEVDGDPADDEYARWTTNGLEGRTEAEFKEDFNLEASTDFYAPGGTDVPVTDGGTGLSEITDGGVMIGSGTGAVTPMAVLLDGEMIVGDGTTDPVAESGATLRTSIGVGTGDSPQFTGIELGHATDTTIVRSGAGDATIEGNQIYRAGGTDVPDGDLADAHTNTTVTVTDDASTNQNMPLVLQAGADPGTETEANLKSDGTAAHYNPSTGLLSATAFEATSTTGNGGLEIDPMPDADHTCEGIISTVTAGATIAIGELVGIATDGEYILADSDGAVPAAAVACEAGTAGNAMEVMISGFIRDDTWNWTTVGEKLYLSNTGGDFIAASDAALPSPFGENLQEVGIATSDDEVLVNIQDPVVSGGVLMETYSTSPVDLTTETACRKRFIMSSTTDASLEFDLPATGLCFSDSVKEYHFINAEAEADAFDMTIDPNGTDVIRIAGDAANCGAGVGIICDGDRTEVILYGISATAWEAVVQTTSGAETCVCVP